MGEPDPECLEYQDFKALFRKRDCSLFKKRTMDCVRGLFSLRKSLQRLEADVSSILTLGEAGGTCPKLAPERQMFLDLSNSVLAITEQFDRELAKTYRMIIKNKNS